MNKEIARCVHCGKGYKSKTCHDKHSVLCEIIHKPATIDETVIPCPKLMYRLIVELTQKYNRLESKLNEQQKWSSQQKRRFNVFEWLTANIVPEYIFDELIDRLTVIPTDIAFMFNNSFYDTLKLILSRTLCNTIPLFAFTHKIGVLFIYIKDKTWIEIPRERLLRFLNIIQKKISKELVVWRQAHTNELETNDSVAITYDKTIAKLFSIDFEKDVNYNKSRLLIYSQIKFDVTSMLS